MIDQEQPSDGAFGLSSHSGSAIPLKQVKSFGEPLILSVGCPTIADVNGKPCNHYYTIDNRHQTTLGVRCLGVISLKILQNFRPDQGLSRSIRHPLSIDGSTV